MRLTRYLNPPAQFSNGVVVVLALGTALGVANGLGQLPGVAAGLAATAVLLAGLRLLAMDRPVATVLGSVAGVVGVLGLVGTPALVVRAAAGRAAGGLGPVALLVPLILIAGVVGLGQEYLPEVGAAERERTMEMLARTASLLVVGLAVVSAARIEIQPLLGLLLPAAPLAPLVELGLANRFTRLGAALLLFFTAWLLVANVLRLPLLRRAAAWVRTRVTAPDDGAERPAGDGERDDPLARVRKAADAVARSRGRLVLLATVMLFVAGGVVLLGLGFAFGAGQPPRLPATFARLSSTGVLGDLVRVVLGLGALRVGHVVAWRVVHVDWRRYRARATNWSGPVVVLAVAVAGSGALVDALAATPSLHYVLTPESGVYLAFTDGGIEVIRFAPRLDALGVYRDTDVFLESLRGLVGLVGAPALVIVPLAITFSLLLVVVPAAAFVGRLVWFVVFGAWDLRGPGQIGIGALFVGTVGATVLGLGSLAAFVGLAVVLLVWDTHRFAAELAATLPETAATLRGELVHLGGNGLVVLGVVALTVGGARLTAQVPVPDAPARGLAAALLALLAGTLALLVLVGSE